MTGGRYLKPRSRALYLSIGLCLTSLPLAHGAVLKSGVVGVTGGACIGFDCNSNTGEDFLTTSLRTKENNTRVGLFNTASADVLGKNWVLEANDSFNGGPSVFRFKAQSLATSPSTPKLSDGTGVGADCSDGATGVTPEPAQVVVPLGAPVIQATETPFGSGNYDCSTVDWYAEAAGLALGIVATDTVTLGSDTQPVVGAVSVGAAAMLRKIRHVGPPTAASDLLPVAGLALLPDQQAEVDALKKMVVALKAQLTALENGDADGDLVPNIDDVFPTDASESADSDGDGIGDNADPFANAVTMASDGAAWLEIVPADAGSTCAVDSFAVSPVGVGAPGTPISQQADFLLNGCAPGEEVTINIDFGEGLPGGAQAFKVDGELWTLIPGASVSGNVLTYTLRDNGDLDLDPAPGVIQDPVSVSLVTPVPLPSWLLLLLGCCVGWLGLRGLRPADRRG